ncbi:kinesin family protein [Apiospora rasikravindrae]|uniref:Kinesin-like protein n=1 Tax=Apiospora rasikravindrae TaxID=990691 RepID=A0ABR1UB46_9PEZI
MATLPRPSRPSVGPPTSALPALPVPKTRKSTGNLHAASDSRISSLPPSPLSGATGNARKPRISTAPKLSHGVPSLLNGGGDSKSVLSSNNVRNSDGLISIASPPQSRSSSAQDSYSTSATTYDDPPDLSSTPTNDKRSSKGVDGKGNVVVSVRVRPDAGASEQGRVEGEWMVDGRKSLVSYRGKEGGDYHYDNVFATHDDNSRVYDHTAKRLVRRVMEGYHGTVFAYGMTGTGKTFSMQGTASSPGVIPLAITDIFSYIRETPSREFLLRVSYLEIYNEKIHDLLSMSTGGGVGVAGAQEEIKLREDSKRGVYATPLKEEIVQSPTQLLRVIARGDQARRTASTQFNARSSRSHAVVQIVVESRERMPASGADSKRSGLVPGGVRVSTLSLIDLAGSEKAAETKERRQEGGHINKSLLTLGNVISKLSDAKKKDGAPLDTKHLPYRDSKLTRLLQGALSGNSLVSILCTIQIGAAGSAASSNSHTAETINTLKFAARAKNSIVSHAKKAEEALGAGGEGGARVLLERYRMEILELRSQLETQVKNKPVEAPEEEEVIKEVVEERMREKEAEARHEEQMLEMQLARTALKERIDHLNKLILSSKSIGVNSSGAYSALGIHPRYSQSSLAPSVRTSIAASSKSHPILERTSSMNSSSSTIGRRSNLQRRPNSGDPSAEEDDSIGEYGDGLASLTAQNQALQSDLADKNRYIATLEKRLLHARRASSSRTSVGFSAPNKGIMVGEDHSVSAVLKEKDAEIAELRARLDDKDRMLGALRSAARSRDAAEGLDKEVPKPEVREVREARTSLLYEQAASPPPSGALPDPPRKSASPSSERRRPKSVDEMSRILDEMIQEKVESGHVVRGVRGSVRIASDGRKIHVPGEATAPAAAAANAEPVRESPTIPHESQEVALEA